MRTRGAARTKLRIASHRVEANVSLRNPKGVAVNIHATHIARAQNFGGRREHARAASEIQHCSILDVVEFVVR